MLPKGYAVILTETEKTAQAFFCQLLRITLLGKIRSDQFKSNNFPGMPALAWLPLGVFKNPGFCDQGVSEAAGPRRRERGCPR